MGQIIITTIVVAYIVFLILLNTGFIDRQIEKESRRRLQARIDLIPMASKAELNARKVDEWVSEFDELVGVPEPNYIDSVEECPDHEVVMAFGVGVVSLYCRCGEGHVLRKVDRWAPA